MDFLRSIRLFSLVYGGKPMDECAVAVERREEGNSLTTVYTFEDGFRVTNIARAIPEFGAYEWVNWLENTGALPTQMITDLFDCDITVPFMHEDEPVFSACLPDRHTATKVYSPTGSTQQWEEFTLDVDRTHGGGYPEHLKPGDTYRIASKNGRSCVIKAPFYAVEKQGHGFMAANGWTGQWNTFITRGTDTVTLRSKLEDTHFRMLPGEKFRTLSMVFMPYDCGFTNASNRWRRLVKKEFSLIGKPGRDTHGAFTTAFWGGHESSYILKEVECIRENKIPFDYIWVDAGWYGADTEVSVDEFVGDWSSHTGDWRVSRKIHPGGLKDVADAVHDAGLKFLLWIEPERVIRTTPTVLAHPEYFLDTDEEDTDNRLLNLGNPEAWQYCHDTLVGLIEGIGIDCYRNDFNLPPLPFWRKNDYRDRRGITEIKYINGLYRLWDTLLERFPSLLIDNCSSGGNRIDIELLRRSVPFWRSDYQCAVNHKPEKTQTHHLNHNVWLPYSGTSFGRVVFDEYAARSAYESVLSSNFFYSPPENNGADPEKVKWFCKIADEYLRVRPYFTEDFYPLTEASQRHDVWAACQFNRPEQRDGIVQAFRRDDSPYETAVFALSGLDETAQYRVIDIDDEANPTVISGAELAKGFAVTLPQKRSAKIFIYQAL